MDHVADICEQERGGVKGEMFELTLPPIASSDDRGEIIACFFFPKITVSTTENENLS